MEAQEHIPGEQLLQVVADAHREQSAMAREAPIGEWETLRLKPLLELPAGKDALPATAVLWQLGAVV